MNDKYMVVSEAKFHTQRLALLDAVTGDVIRRLGEKGQSPGQLLWPTGLTFTQGGEACTGRKAWREVCVARLGGKCVWRGLLVVRLGGEAWW